LFNRGGDEEAAVFANIEPGDGPVRMSKSAFGTLASNLASASTSATCDRPDEEQLFTRIVSDLSGAIWISSKRIPARSAAPDKRLTRMRRHVLVQENAQAQ